jgi:hypothetical protein
MTTNNFFIQQPNSQIITETYYCMSEHADYYDNGMPCANSESDNALAKTVTISGKHNKYYIRFGFDQKLYDPLSPTNASKNYTELNRNSENYKFKLVNESTFNFYLKYLSSKNNIWLIKAQREVV